MALQSSGAISLSEIQGEFGGSNPASLSEYYGAASGIPSSGAVSFSDFYGTSAYTPAGSQTRTSTSETNFTVPANVSEIHILCVGGGGAGGNYFWAGAGGAGGNLTWVNKIPVTPGETLRWRAGAGGTAASGRGAGGSGSPSYVKRGSTYLCYAGGGGGGQGSSGGNAGGSPAANWSIPAGVDGKSNRGGWGGDQENNEDDSGGGGGAAGYNGSGGRGWDYRYGVAYAGNGGGGGGSYFTSYNFAEPRAAPMAGGVGLGGQGSNGVAGSNLSRGGGGGSGGQDGSESGGSGGRYGAGSSGIGKDDDANSPAPNGAPGAVKIMWGTDASWPNNPTNS